MDKRNPPFPTPAVARFCLVAIGGILACCLPLSQDKALSGFLLLLLGASLWSFLRKGNALFIALLLAVGFIGTRSSIEEKERQWQWQSYLRSRIFSCKHFVHLEGSVLCPPLFLQSPGGPHFSFRIQLQKILANQGNALPLPTGWDSTTWVKCSGLTPALLYGDRVRLIGRPRSLSTPLPTSPSTEFPFAQKRCLLEINSGSSRNLTIASKGMPFSLTRFLQLLNSRSARAFDAYLTHKPAGMLKCLILGRTRALSASDRIDLIRCGALHYYAISGFHLGLLSGFLWLVLRSLRVPSPIMYVILLSFIPAFSIFTGLRTPILRAGIMAFFYLSGKMVRKKMSSFHTLAMSGVCILLLRPLDLFAPGFQLSFSSVFGILLFYSLFHQILDFQGTPPSGAFSIVLRRILRPARTLFALSSAAFLGNFPIMLAFFRRISLLAPFSSLVLFPSLLAFILLGILLPPLAYLWPEGAHGCAYFIEISCSVFSGLLSTLASLPFSLTSLPPPSPLFLLLYFGIASISGCAKRLSLLLPFSFLFYLLPQGPGEKAVVTFLPAGRGIAITFCSPGNGNLLLHGGYWGGRNAVDKKVLPQLYNSRVRELDLVVPCPPLHAFQEEMEALQEGVPVRSLLTESEIREISNSSFPGTRGISIKATPILDGRILFSCERGGIKKGQSSILFINFGKMKVLCLHARRWQRALWMWMDGGLPRADILHMHALPGDAKTLSCLMEAIQPRFLIVTGAPSFSTGEMASVLAEKETFFLRSDGPLSFYWGGDKIQATVSWGR